jgi:hypothetical protein
MNLKITKYIEEDSSITLSLEDFGIAVNKPNEQQAMNALTFDLNEYINEFYDNIEFYSSDKKRIKQMNELERLQLEKDIIEEFNERKNNPEKYKTLLTADEFIKHLDKCASHKEMCERYGYTVEEVEELAEIVEIE